MADIKQLERALIKADAAGDSDAAKVFASEIRKMRAAPASAPSIDTDREQAQAYIESGRQERLAAAQKQGRSEADGAVAGMALGVSDIGNTVLNAASYLPGKVDARIAQWSRTRNADFDRIADAHKDTSSFGAFRTAGNIASTLPVGGTLGAGLKAASPALVRAGASAPVVAGLSNALTTGGMRAGATPGAGNMLMRIAGGAATGGASAGLVNPENADIGALVGGALPPVLATVGKAGRAIGSKLAGPAVAPEVRQAVEAARTAGYVIPPTQARPSLANRALEGFAGKITTAQNASAKNQPITNELARKAIGAADLSEAGIAQVRQKANQAYDALGQVGKFRADAGFGQALDNAAATSAAMRQNFPELVNTKVDDLIAGLKSRPEFDAQPTIEAIKQFRADSATNKIALDPAQKALGRAQGKIAGALEDLIERNLQAGGNPHLLEAYRGARQTLAKTYQVEKALNKTTGNVDGGKLAQMMQKGKPMTGDLRTIADFAARFPKANQTVERMGSLPGVSPLDFGAMATTSAVTGNPLMMAGVLARPAARGLALSGPVQNRLAKQPGQNVLNRLMSNEAAEQLLYRSAPAASSR